MYIYKYMNIYTYIRFLVGVPCSDSEIRKVRVCAPPPQTSTWHRVAGLGFRGCLFRLQTPRKVDIWLPGKGNSYSHGAMPVY